MEIKEITLSERDMQQLYDDGLVTRNLNDNTLLNIKYNRY